MAHLKLTNIGLHHAPNSMEIVTKLRLSMPSTRNMTIALRNSKLSVKVSVDACFNFNFVVGLIMAYRIRQNQFCVWPPQWMNILQTSKRCRSLKVRRRRFLNILLRVVEAPWTPPAPIRRPRRQMSRVVSTTLKQAVLMYWAAAAAA